MAKKFRYEINVMEQAANKMNRTGYSTRWSEIAYRIGNKTTAQGQDRIGGFFVF